MPGSVISQASGRSGNAAKPSYNIRQVRRMADWQKPTQPLHLRIPDPRNTHVQIKAMSSMERLAGASAYGGDAETIYGFLSDRGDDNESLPGSMRTKTNYSHVQRHGHKARPVTGKSCSTPRKQKSHLSPLPQSFSSETITSQESMPPTPPLSRERSHDGTNLSHSSNSSQYQIATPKTSSNGIGESLFQMYDGSSPPAAGPERDLFARLANQTFAKQALKDESGFRNRVGNNQRPWDDSVSRDDSFPPHLPARQQANRDEESPSKRNTARPLPRTPPKLKPSETLRLESDSLFADSTSTSTQALHSKSEWFRTSAKTKSEPVHESMRDTAPTRDFSHQSERTNTMRGPKPAEPVGRDHLESTYERPSKIFSSTNYQPISLQKKAKDLVPSVQTGSILDRSRPRRTQAQPVIEPEPEEEQEVILFSQEIFEARKDDKRQVQKVSTRHLPVLQASVATNREPSILDRSRPKLKKAVLAPVEAIVKVEPLRVVEKPATRAADTSIALAQMPSAAQQNLASQRRDEIAAREASLARQKRDEVAAREAKLRQAAKEEMNQVKIKQMKQVQQTHKMLLEGSWTPEAVTVPQLPQLPTLNSSSTISGQAAPAKLPIQDTLPKLDFALGRDDATAAARSTKVGAQLDTIMKMTGVASIDAIRFQTALSQVPALMRTGAEKNLWVRQWATAVDEADKEVRVIDKVASASTFSPIKKQLTLKTISPIKLDKF